MHTLKTPEHSPYTYQDIIHHTCTSSAREPAYRLNDVVCAVGKTSDVNFGLQFAVRGSEETLGAVDAHDSLLADLDTDAALQFLHGDLCMTHVYHRDVK